MVVVVVAVYIVVMTDKLCLDIIMEPSGPFLSPENHFLLVCVSVCYR